VSVHADTKHKGARILDDELALVLLHSDVDASHCHGKSNMVPL
jgi:hypothetical protein